MNCKTIAYLLTCFIFFSTSLSYAAVPVKRAQVQVTISAAIKELLDQTEKDYHIPTGLLTAIAKVESRFNPYALNVAGKTLIAASSEEAETIIQNAIDRGVDNIDIGIMQVNTYWHRASFSSFKEMLDPKVNIKYAAAFLSSLYKEYGDWHTAVRYYHSRTPERYRHYSRKVTLAWIES